METEALLATMAAYALEHHVPIIDVQTRQWLATFLAHKKMTSVLEIGGAIGYSTMYLQQLTQGSVLSVERDVQRFEQAQRFLADFSERAAIMFVHGDAKDVAFLQLVEREAPYDLLFIDASKRHNQAFFELFSPFVKKGGYIITDNMQFHGLVDVAVETIPRRLRPLVRSIQTYRHWLERQETFQTTFVPVGDMLAVSQKIE